MKKFTLLLSLLFAIVSVQAQDYLISFAGTGASTIVGTVTVENLTQGKIVSLSGSEVLHLVATGTGIKPVLDNENALRIYPNPTTDNSTLDFVATASGKVNIELFDITGRRIGAAQNSLTIGTHSYRVSGLRSGIYTVRIISPAYSYTGKLISNGVPGSDVKISYLGYGEVLASAKMLKSASTEKTMQYTTGDRLKFTSTSGNYKTISTDIPTQSKTITFPFIACTDGVGNNYPVVQIGNRVWMVENLKTTKYNDGTNIPNVTDNSAWGKLTTPGYCWYNNDVANKNTYGALYNWYAVNTGKLAPIGWHVPTDYEWGILLDYLGSEYLAGGKLKETGIAHWKSPNTGATNESGFTALPGGRNYGEFGDVGLYGYWWSSTAYYDPNFFGKWKSECLAVNSDYSLAGPQGDINEYDGFSVRCVWDTYVPNAGTVNDIDGNVYHNVTIGTQVWMVENLKTTKYNNGDIIGTTTPATLDITGQSSPKYQWAYAGNESKVATYGRLYTWYAVNDNRGICPTGWHVPTDAEWTTLTTYLGGENVAGGKLKETGKAHWDNPNTGAINAKGFTALPGGERYFGGTFDEINSTGYWWSSTEIEDNTADAWYRAIDYSDSDVYRFDDNYKAYGMSVRCLRDLAESAKKPTMITIDAKSMTAISASSGGIITSDGGAAIIDRGVCWNTTGNPSLADNITSDGIGTGIFTSILTGLISNTTYYIRAYATNSAGTGYGNELSFSNRIIFNPDLTYGTVTDIDGNVYKTVQIGTQIWMAENLKTTKYNDGTSIPYISDNTTWSILTTPGYCWNNNEIANKNTYGALYNWYTVKTGKLCPKGWHVPTDAEWATLTTYLGGVSVAGGKLKETGPIHWHYPNTGATNETGFTALPGGYRSNDGTFCVLDGFGDWWSSSEFSIFYSLDWCMTTYDSNIGSSGEGPKGCGFSVRCVKDL